MTTDPAILTQLTTILDAIRDYGDPRRASAEWKQAYKLLQAMGLPAGRVTHVVGMRDVAGLEGLLAEVVDPAVAASAVPPPVDVPDMETCRRALRAFRKRLSLTRLDDESRISSHNLLTKGEDSSILAIEPPNEWPEAVWLELVRQGKLVNAGHGFYRMPK
jgi:hypothetical protein